jgi:hypothetical protein
MTLWCLISSQNSMASDPTFSCPAAADWAVAVGTVVLAFVAVFQQWLQQLVVRPRLSLNARVARPDAEKNKWTNGADVYYFRLAVINEGNAAARDVQVYLAGVERLRADNRYEPVERFSPMSLLWAHIRQTTKPIIVPKMPPLFCDLAHVSDPSKKSVTQESLPGVAATDAVLGLDVEVVGFASRHLLEPGTYKFNLKLAASNHPPRDYTLEVVFPGKWFDNQEKMFSDGFGLRLV